MSDPFIYAEFTQAREAGVSKAKTDSASAFPVPDGTGNHTVAGITYRLFVDLADEMGYAPTTNNFYNMVTNGIWNKIYNRQWHAAHADLINSQAIAQLVFQALWGGGPALHEWLVNEMQKFFKDRLEHDGKLGNNTATIINMFTANKAQELAYCMYVHEKRLQYLRSLKAYKANGKGWESRAEKLKAFNIKLIQG